MRKDDPRRIPKNETFSEFVARQHRIHVNHFVDYCITEDRAPTVADAVVIFGFCERDAKPIVEDAIKQMAESA